MTEVFGVRPGSYWRAKVPRNTEPKWVRKDGYRIQLTPKMYWRQGEAMRVESIEQDGPNSASLQIVMEASEGAVQRSYAITYYQLRYYFERDFNRGI